MQEKLECVDPGLESHLVKGGIYSLEAVIRDGKTEAYVVYGPTNYGTANVHHPTHFCPDRFKIRQVVF